MFILWYTFFFQAFTFVNIVCYVSNCSDIFLKCIALQKCLEGKSKGKSKNKNFGSPSSFVDLWCAHLTPWSCVHACVPNCFSHVQFFVTLWTIAHQASLSKGISRQEYWSRLPCPSPGDLCDSGVDPRCLCLLHWQASSLPLMTLGKPHEHVYRHFILFYKEKW